MLDFYFSSWNFLKNIFSKGFFKKYSFKSIFVFKPRKRPIKSLFTLIAYKITCLIEKRRCKLEKHDLTSALQSRFDKMNISFKETIFKFKINNQTGFYIILR